MSTGLEKFTGLLRYVGEVAVEHGVDSLNFGDACKAVVTGIREALSDKRASQLADERQRFVDQAAIAVRAASFGNECLARMVDADDAYGAAEALWVEREKRRLPKPHPTMKRYRAADGSLVDAFQITAEWFDGEHPNPLHVAGVETDPVARCVHPRNAAGSSRAYVGNWIVRKAGAEHWFAYGPGFLSDHEEVK